MPTIQKLVADLELGRTKVLRALAIVLTAFTTVECFRGYQFGSRLQGDFTVWNYVVAAVVLIAGLLACANGVMMRYESSIRRPGIRSREHIPWFVFGAAMIAFSFDKDLSLHERAGVILDRSAPWLKPLVFTNADGLIQLVCGVGAVLFTIHMIRKSLPTSTVRRYFVAGVAMCMAFTFMDYLLERFWDPFNFVEEILEMLAGWAFIAASLTALTHSMTGVLHAISAYTQGLSVPAPRDEEYQPGLQLPEVK